MSVVLPFDVLLREGAESDRDRVVVVDLRELVLLHLHKQRHQVLPAHPQLHPLQQTAKRTAAAACYAACYAVLSPVCLTHTFYNWKLSWCYITHSITLYNTLLNELSSLWTYSSHTCNSPSHPTGKPSRDHWCSTPVQRIPCDRTRWMAPTTHH